LTYAPICSVEGSHTIGRAAISGPVLNDDVTIQTNGRMLSSANTVKTR